MSNPESAQVPEPGFLTKVLGNELVRYLLVGGSLFVLDTTTFLLLVNVARVFLWILGHPFKAVSINL